MPALNNLETLKEAIKQLSTVKEAFTNAQLNIDMMVNENDDPIIVLAAIIKYMQTLGKNDAESMANAKELVAELEKCGI